MALTSDFNERLASIRGTNQSNCIGTALYLAGLEDIDEYYDTDMAYNRVLKQLREASTPEIGSLVVWLNTDKQKVYVCHMAVITKKEPLLITHRPGIARELCEDVEFRIVNQRWGFPDISQVLERDVGKLEVKLYDPTSSPGYKPRVLTKRERRNIKETFEEPCS